SATGRSGSMRWRRSAKVRRPGSIRKGGSAVAIGDRSFRLCLARPYGGGGSLLYCSRPMTKRLTRHARRKPATPLPAEPVELAIRRLGGRGDGIGDLDGVPAYVAGALPGER